MKIKTSFWIFFIGIICLICLPALVRKNQFVDSMTYSSIAKDIALEKSTAFTYYYLDYEEPFYDHPPLSMWMQSTLFYLFPKNDIIPHALYTLILLFLNIISIRLLWRLLIPKRKEFDLLPLFFWILTPVIFWSFSNNLLENLLCPLCMLSVYYGVLSAQNPSIKKLIYPLLSCLFLTAAFFTKGLVGLFPLAVIPIYFIIYRDNKTLISFCYQLLFLVTIGITLFNIEAIHNLFTNYFNTQLLPSIKGERMNNSEGHFFILMKLIIELTPIVCLSLLLLFLKKISFTNANKKAFWLLVLIGFSASLPLMISPKSHGFYIVPAIPYFALAMSSIINVDFPKITNWLKQYTIYVRLAAITTLAIGIYIIINSFNAITNDNDKIEFAHEVAYKLPDNIRQIDVDTEVEYDFTLRGYLIRYHNIHSRALDHNKDYKLIYKWNYKQDSIVLQKDDWILIKKN